MMKRLFSLILALLFSAALAACTAAPVDTDTASTAPADTVSVPRTDSASLSSLPEGGTDTDTDTDTDTGTAPVSSDPVSEPSVSDSASASEPTADTDTDSDGTSAADETPAVYTDPITGRVILHDDDPARVEPVMVFDHYDNVLYVLDASVTDWDDPKAILWQWPLRKASGGLSQNKQYRSTCVDHKYRIDPVTGEEYIVTGGHAYACLVAYPSGKILWDVGVKGANIHSMEYLPDGNIAVANSGGWLRVYAASQGQQADPYYAEAEISGCHGCLWDPQRESLWVIGTKYLSEYKITGTAARPELELIKDYSLPSSGGHDLAAVYGTPDLLWCTAGKTWLFSKSAGRFYATYEGSALTNAKGGVKGIGNFADCSKVLWVFPNGTQNQYHSDRIYVCEWKTQPNGSIVGRYSERVSSKWAFYKLRIFDPSYQ